MDEKEEKEKSVKEKLACSITKDDVSSRKQGKVNLTYIESHKAIRNANEVFGFDGWSSELVSLEQVCSNSYDIADWKDGVKVGTKPGFKVGYEARVKIVANIDGTTVTREDVGFGSGIAGDLCDAVEGANKEAVSDAEKRALRKFGDMFALCLYDKDCELHVKAKSFDEMVTVEDFDEAIRGFKSAKQCSALWYKWKEKFDKNSDEYHHLNDLSSVKKTLIENPALKSELPVWKGKKQ